MAPTQEPAPDPFSWRKSDFLQVEHEVETATLWITLTTTQKPCLRRQLIEDFNALADTIKLEHGRKIPSPNQSIKFVVLRSDSDRVFNLGGDLDHFVDAITAGSVDSLRYYGRIGAAGCLSLASGFGASIITISLVRGIAVGGGFEVARCCNYMVAEEDAVFQLPEANFGLFPASGIISIISPRIGPKATRELVVECRRLSCADALATDVLDAIAATGDGERRVRELIVHLTPRHAAAVATHRGLHRMAGITMEALVDEADLWARSAMHLSPDSLSTMRRLSKAQARRFKVDPPFLPVEVQTDPKIQIEQQIQVEPKKGLTACH